MILLDTNVWVYAVSHKKPSITEAVAHLMRGDQILAHPFVYGELILGRGGKTRNEVIRAYRNLRTLDIVPHDQVCAFVERHRLANQGVGWVDAHLLAAAHEAGARIWTEEAALDKAAQRLGIAYSPSGGHFEPGH